MRSLKLILLLTLLLFLVLPNLQIQALSSQEERAALEEELKELEEQIAQYEKDISKTQQEKNTLQNQIYILKQQINKLNLQIYQSNVMIGDLGLQITDTQTSIDETSLKIEESKDKLSSLLRSIYEEDQRSLVEILLAEPDLSSFFDNLVALEALNKKNQELLANIKSLKSYLEGQKQTLDTEKQDLERLVTIQTLQKQESETTQKDKDYYLQLTETQYQKYLQEKGEVEKKAVEVRARIFELIGVPEAPTFGEAYEIAKSVERITGVRPALLLAVLTQESNIGKNVGQCYLTNLKTGAGVNIRMGAAVNNVMKPMGLNGRRGDVDDFLKITAELGRKWNETPVSCPIPSVGGYGGAMGPAQFIPTTWMIYKDKIAKITGQAANPWSIKDSFLAAALYLADYGAAKQIYNAEWKAAMIYFSGTTNTRYRFYGDSVMAIATNYAKDIETLEKAG
ncbi:MAG: hypothetical protein AUJ31_00915 [Parcubacteria group bacterium CG1_02_39_15]|uniref:Transglycosylase SLT domain-containing protein n=3 Tax=Candidatus Nealsoniibacteriota TaxID=1817911 RepID=A0A2G9YSE7_9BACT|nr:MAG: hypothetical protein AUJ31_00915 [Parcubacteria group bacterium CG1_02_39_15]PIP22175.1 MAG: hypothetical protein COX38_02030 [Candidatus Nealsonbacteria bacterium CG23_combo_of_CG06-09_8_20_14_all_39_25]PIQ98543.1 MAG: hypothetical protein COV64_00660 [Candidatus Nealsonbacteria bacterium CG11_big_fil_rev_8_21_14_0_20_39_9]